MDDIPAIREMLSSGPESSGLDAVARLSEADNPDAMRVLLEVLGDHRWRVRKAAAEALQKVAGPPVVETLVDVIRRHPLEENILNTAVQVLASAGTNVIPSMAGLLKEPDPQVRLHAARTLGLLHEPGGAPALRHALSDPDENVRFHAVEALATLRDQASVPMLLDRLAGESPFVQFAIVEALGSIGDTGAVPALLPLLEDDLLGPAVIRALSSFSDERAVGPLIRLLDNDDSTALDAARALASIQERFAQDYGESDNVSGLVRQAAPVDLAERLLARLNGSTDPAWIKILGWLRPSGIAPRLLRLLHSDEQRGSAADVLSTLGPDALDVVAAELDDDDPEVRKAACVVLGRLGNRRAARSLATALDDESTEVRLAAAAAIARVGAPEVLDTLLAHLDDPDPHVRQTIVEAINSIGSPDTMDKVLPLLEAGSARTRETAIQILGYFGFPEALDPILERLEDPDEAVRRAVISVLPYFDDPRTSTILRQALESASPRLRGEAVRAVGRSNFPGATAAIRKALDDTAPLVRYRACLVLGELGDRKNRKALAAMLGDPAPMVRVAACRALGQLGGRLPVEEIAHLLAEEDPEVRYAALSVLGKVRHPAALAALRVALESKEPQARIGAALGLSDFGRRGIAPLLHLADSDPELDVRRAALEALAGIKTPEAIRALLRLAGDPRLRESAIADLVEIARDDPAGIDRFLRASQASVALAAVTVLTRVRRHDATEALAAAATDRKLGQTIREAATQALRVLGRTDLLETGRRT